MAEGVQDTFTYKVDLDTQGLAGQLASVRDIVGRGLGQAGGAVSAGMEIGGGATNRIVSDISMGSQLIAGAVPAQMAMSLPPMGIAGTTLANVPGMPQSFGQELAASLGVSRAPLGVFPSQFQAVANQRLNERLTMGLASATSGVASMLVGGGLGSLVGTAVGGPVGGIVGSVAGTMLGDVAMSPILSDLQNRMADRARTQQIFGWNQFRDDERHAMAGHMGQQFTKSLFSPEAFNAVLPAATMAGMFTGMGKGDVGGFKNRFNQAQAFFTEGQYALQLSGSGADVMKQGQLAQGMRGMGIKSTTDMMSMFRQGNALSQQMRELGEFVDPTENIERAMQVGQAAFQMGVAPKKAAQQFMNMSSMTNRMIADKVLSDDDMALLGANPGEAAQRLTMGVMATQRQPVFKAMALAFSTGSGTGIDHAAIEQIGAGRMSFSALSDRMAQMGAGEGGTTKMLTAMANQGKLQGDMMKHSGQMLMGMTDDLLKQANMEVTEGTRMFVMQRAFGVGEAESRALVNGLPMEKADQARLEKESASLERDIKGATDVAKTGVAREITEFTRGLKETIGKPLDDILRSIVNELVPPVQGVRDRLDTLNSKVGATSFRSNSPISAGPIMFGQPSEPWAVPPDPSQSYGFRMVSESRKYPAAMISARVNPPEIGSTMAKLTNLRETVAG
jgi:hypothetical protein